MIHESLFALLLTAASLGFIHTVLGPDHYVPFLAIARARNWSMPKTVTITTVCGLAHVGSSVIIGLVGLRLSTELSRLKLIESMRGELTAWLIIAFGLIYLIWAVKKKVSGHQKEDLMESLSGNDKQKPVNFKGLLPWTLFVVFLFGPCEPLIPLLMFPAAGISQGSIFLVAGIFGITTIATMLVMVLVPLYGFKRIKIPLLQNYGQIIAAVLILFCGLGIQFMGL